MKKYTESELPQIYCEIQSFTFPDKLGNACSSIDTEDYKDLVEEFGEEIVNKHLLDLKKAYKQYT